MTRVEQSLAGFISNPKTVLVGINLTLWERRKHSGILLPKLLMKSPTCGKRRRYLVFLMAVQQRLSSGYVIGQFVSIDQGLHLRHPAGQIPEVSSEALQPAGNTGQSRGELCEYALILGVVVVVVVLGGRL